MKESKKKETLENLIKASSVLSENFGRIFVHFGKPISLRQHVQVIMKKNLFPFAFPFSL
jgi:glycerol-3-phosphate O-acyltransferase